MHSELLEGYQAITDSLSVSVKIDWREVDRIFVNRAISLRNGAGSKKTKDAYDIVLLGFLGKEDFEKHVSKGKKIKR